MERNRRRVLRTLGVASAAGLAGCSGDGLVAPPESGGESDETTGTVPKWTGLVQSTKLALGDGDGGGDFGYSLGLSRDGTTALVGARYDDADAPAPGSAHVFTRAADGWSEQTELVPADDEEGDAFAEGVALSRDGTTALIGARGTAAPEVEYPGRAYVFAQSEDSWRQEARLVPDDGGLASFGSSLALSWDGTTALVGADDDGSNGVRAGSAFVFSQSEGDWRQEARLLPDDGSQGDHFGIAVALSRDGTTALIGAHGDEGPRTWFRGSAYVFSRSPAGWNQRAKLVPDGGTEDFGYSLSLAADGRTTLVGAPSEDTDAGRYAGAAYVFSNSRGSWEQQARLTLDDADAKEGFGVAVGFSGTGRTALVGTLRDGNVSGRQTGSAYLFSQTADGWDQRAKLVPDDRKAGDQFGISAALAANGRTAVVGAPYHEAIIGEDSGAAYLSSEEGSS